MFGHFEENIARTGREKQKRGISADGAWPVEWVDGRNRRQVTGSNELCVANSDVIRPHNAIYLTEPIGTSIR